MRRLKYRKMPALILIMLLASLIALNAVVSMLEKSGGWRLDWSFNSITTHSAETTEMLKQLQKPVHIYALYRRGEEDAPLMELLDRYAAATPLITWEQADPSLNPALLSQYSSETKAAGSDSLIVTCGETGRWQVLTAEDFVNLGLDTETGNYTSAGWTYERSISGAIRYVTKDRIPRIIIAQGHGELDEDTVSAFAELMKSNQYETVFSTLSAGEVQPEEGDLLVFFSPLRDLTEAELETVKQFADRGGSFLFTCDYSDPIGKMSRYAALMRSYGIIPKEGIVCADPSDTESYDLGSRIQLIPEVCSTDITLDLISLKMTALLLPGCRAFETPEEGDRNLMAAEVLRSPESSYLKQITAETTHMNREDGDAGGPFTLAIQSRRVTEGGFVSRAFAVGCSALFTENQVWAMTDSQQLILRIMEFLVDTEASDLKIMAKDATRPALSVGGIGLGSVMVVALPVLTLAAAMAVLIPRRRGKHAEG